MILGIVRHFNLMFTSGFTAYIIYSKGNKFSACKTMLEENKSRALVLPPPIKILLDEVIQEMKLEEEVKSKIKIFCSETADFVRHGAAADKNGAILGIPQHFLIDERFDVKVSTLDDKNKISDVKNSHSLTGSMHLSNEAKKFAIARELYELIHSNHERVYTVPYLVNLQFVLLSAVVERFSVKKKKNINYFFHFGLLLMGAIAAAFAYDFITCYTETNSDFLACDLGKSYINGGIEYYTKTIKRNKELKKIDNKAPYSEDGDVNYALFRKHHIPLKKRLIYLRDHYKQEKPVIWNYILFPY